MRKLCQWVVAIDRTPRGSDMLVPAFVEMCYNLSSATIYTGDGTKVGRVCRKHAKAARLEGWKVKRGLGR